MEELYENDDKDIRYVVKREGNKVPYQTEKIKRAILKAMISADSVNEELAEKIARLSTERLYLEIIKKEFHMLMMFMIWWKIS